MGDFVLGDFGKFSTIMAGFEMSKEPSWDASMSKSEAMSGNAGIVGKGSGRKIGGGSLRLGDGGVGSEIRWTGNGGDSRGRFN